MAAYQAVEASETLYAANFKAISAWLTETHGFALHADDLPGIDYVYRTAFFTGGPNLTYNLAGRGARGGFGPGNTNSTYAAIQSLDDGRGTNRGFLATEENWRAMKAFHTRNLLVPVVGDFGGAKAIRAVGAYLKSHNLVVSAFYLSNVEQYLNRSSGTEDAFLCNVASLPLDEASTFIYTGAGRFGGGLGGGRGGGGGGGLNTTFLRPILPDARSCTASGR